MITKIMIDVGAMIMIDARAMIMIDTGAMIMIDIGLDTIQLRDWRGHNCD